MFAMNNVLIRKVGSSMLLEAQKKKVKRQAWQGSNKCLPQSSRREGDAPFLVCLGSSYGDSSVQRPSKHVQQCLVADALL